MQDYRKLLVYKEAFNLTKEIYALTKNWPPEELYGLINQIRRSTHSVDSNICEGASRNSIPDSLRFFYHAYASLKETENHLRLAYELDYATENIYGEVSVKINRLGGMLNNFIRFKRTKIPAPVPREPPSPTIS